MRFSGGEMLFHRLEIRSKAMNVAEIESKSGSSYLRKYTVYHLFFSIYTSEMCTWTAAQQS